MVLVAFWRRSRFSTQSVLGATSRCRHRSDGVEGQAFGRALGHSGRLRPHPDHVHVRTLLLGLSESLFHDLTSLHTPLELSVIDPHAVEDDGEFSGNSNDGFFVSAGLGQLHSPSLEWCPLTATREH